MLAATIGFVLLAGCTSDETSRPNVDAPVVQDDIEGHSSEYAFAYGIGLSAGCDPAESLDGYGLKGETEAFEAYEEALQRNPEETRAGFRAGVERGLAEQAADNSDVC